MGSGVLELELELVIRCVGSGVGGSDWAESLGDRLGGVG